MVALSEIQADREVTLSAGPVRYREVGAGLSLVFSRTKKARARIVWPALS